MSPKKSRNYHSTLAILAQIISCLEMLKFSKKKISNKIFEKWKNLEGNIFLFKNGKFLILIFSYLFNYISSKKVFKTLKSCWKYDFDMPI